MTGKPKTCSKCAACCSHLIVAMLVPTEDDKEFYEARGFMLEDKEGRLIATMDVPHVCPQLNDEGLCKLHLLNAKPSLCVRYPSYVKDKSTLPESCVWHMKKQRG